jgi:epoxyqueuosine reductase
VARGRAGVAELRGSRLLSEAQSLRDTIAREAKGLGFDAFGITAPDAIPDALPRLQQFLAEGAHGDMAWLAANPERRAGPRTLWSDVRSVNYGPDDDPLQILKQRDRGAISTYARGDDYHDVIKSRLKTLARWMVAHAGGDVKVFVDTAAVMEKPLSEAAGLGWQGKHTNLVSREFGSWLFIGSIFTTLDLPKDGGDDDRCGSCRACLDACPTEAFPAPYRLDARRCISYLTIEHKGPIPREFRKAIGNRIYGCDDCQLVCPWNKFARMSSEMDFVPRHALDGAKLVELFAWSEAQFLERTEGSAIRRIGYECWIRNIAVALGNAPTNEAVIAALNTRRHDPSALVREHVEWALAQHATSAATSP